MPQTDPGKLLAGVELGGTKCICILGTDSGETLDMVRLPTEDPGTTLPAIEAVLDRWLAEHGVAALGIGSFGPVDLDRASPAYGHIAATPKPGWAGVDLAGRFARRYGLPTGFSTDVIGAALAERRWGGGQGLNSLAYVTVGTGVGVGLIASGRPVVGFTHPELGHIRIVRAEGDDWPGACPFHGACVEGLASGPSIEARLGVKAETLPPDHPVWPLVAHALAQLLHAMIAATAPRRILIGGGVMQAHLFPLVRRLVAESVNGYIALPPDLDAYIAPPALGDRAGPLGALALAADSLAS